MPAPIEPSDRLVPSVSAILVSDMMPALPVRSTGPAALPVPVSEDWQRSGELIVLPSDTAAPALDLTPDHPDRRSGPRRSRRGPRHIVVAAAGVVALGLAAALVLRLGDREPGAPPPPVELVYGSPLASPPAVPLAFGVAASATIEVAPRIVQLQPLVPVEVALTNPSAAALDWSVDVPDGAPLTVTPELGTIEPGAAATLTIAAVPDDLRGPVVEIVELHSGTAGVAQRIEVTIAP